MGERSKQFPIEFKHLEQKTFISSTSSKSLFFKAFIYIFLILSKDSFVMISSQSITHKRAVFLTVNVKNMLSRTFSQNELKWMERQHLIETYRFDGTISKND